MEIIGGKNPFDGYLEKLKIEKKKINPIHEIVNMYYVLRKIDKKPKSFYTGKMGYGKLAKEAKTLYTVLNKDLEDCLWAIDKMNYLAEKGNFNWSISTCLKHKKL